ncbi:unnamed protein product [Adineta steineri]|uniref:Uncharacterized protein n=1 Tax=Adineta steineri TaxID=433720 RepID=A0A813UMD1_9BILA|nr:unnamed protein product [Adineta steineri]CAF0933611.1 unnamed protein product [Adineta steineri]
MNEERKMNKRLEIKSKIYKNFGQKFKPDLQKQIIEEIKRVYTRIIINDVHTKITDNSKIGPDKIATNAYNDSIGSNPPDANNIMKYIIDINRYYMELVLNEVQMKSID